MTNIIQAHKSPLACVTLNSSGTLLATASDKGTVIRVFSVPNGDKVAQFRRGTYGARIFSIAFNPVSSLLCVSSDTETVHIFKLVRDAERERAKSTAGGRAEAARRAAQQSSYTNDDDDEDASQTGSIARYNAAGGGRGGGGGAGGGGGYDAYIDDKRSRGGGGVGGTLRKSSLKFGRSLVGGIGGLLPGPVSELWDPQRDFAFLKLPTGGVKSVVALSGTGPNVMVLTSEGIYYSYLIDLENGGECTLQKSYKCVAVCRECRNADPFTDCRAVRPPLRWHTVSSTAMEVRLFRRLPTDMLTQTGPIGMRACVGVSEGDVVRQNSSDAVMGHGEATQPRHLELALWPAYNSLQIRNDVFCLLYHFLHKIRTRGHGLDEADAHPARPDASVRVSLFVDLLAARARHKVLDVLELCPARTPLDSDHLLCNGVLGHARRVVHRPEDERSVLLRHRDHLALDGFVHGCCRMNKSAREIRRSPPEEQGCRPTLHCAHEARPAIDALRPKGECSRQLPAIGDASAGNVWHFELLRCSREQDHRRNVLFACPVPEEQCEPSECYPE